MENINRILPAKTKAVIDTTTWKTPDLFTALQKMGNVPQDDMYRTFNMGIGYVAVVNPKDVSTSLKMLKGSKVVGKISSRKSSEHQVELIF